MVTFCVIGYYLVCYKGDLIFLTSPFCLLLRGLNVKPIRLLEEGVAPLKVKQVVLLLETTWTSHASQALSGVGRISKTTKAAHLMKGALPLVRQIFGGKKRQS